MVGEMLQIHFPNEKNICVFLKRREGRLEDDVIALRSAPPAGQRQACPRHGFMLYGRTKS